MTLKELKDMLMLQMGNDVEDYSDYAIQALIYLNEGYGRAYQHWVGVYPDMPLALDTDIPALPSHVHSAIVDWATWLMYRNGNPSKQNRGYAFRQSAEKTLRTLPLFGGKSAQERYAAGRFKGLYDS